MITKEYLEKIYKVKNIIRYNNKLKLTHESVAEHSFFVSLITIKICEEYDLPDEIVFKCVLKSLLHDMPEMDINDITHDAKEVLNLRGVLKKYEDKFYIENFKKYANLMMDDSDDIVNAIVSYSDALSVRQYIDCELSLGNNTKEILEIDAEIDKRIKKLKTHLEGLL